MLDFSKLSLAELKDLRARAIALMELKRDQALVRTRMEIEEILARDGFTINDILVKHATIPKKPVVVMYQNPGNQFETWGGRGRQPAWVKQQLESGKALDELKINKGDAT